MNENTEFWPGFEMGQKILVTNVFENYFSYYKVPQQRDKEKCLSGFLIRFLVDCLDTKDTDRSIAICLQYLNQLKLPTKFLTEPLAQNHFIAMDKNPVRNYYLFFRLPQSIVPSTLCKRFDFKNEYLKPAQLHLL